MQGPSVTQPLSEEGEAVAVVAVAVITLTITATTVRIPHTTTSSVDVEIGTEIRLGTGTGIGTEAAKTGAEIVAKAEGAKAQSAITEPLRCPLFRTYLPPLQADKIGTLASGDCDD
jgi:antitoxin component of MazEF toxin-antitoxin module